MSYPKWKYHVSLPGIIVYSEDEEKALGPEWVDEHVSGYAVPEVKRGPGRPKKEDE